MRSGSDLDAAWKVFFYARNHDNSLIVHRGALALDLHWF
jgi:hypothetical protein